MLSKLTQFAEIAQIIEGLVGLFLLIYALGFARELREAIKARHLDGVKYVKDLIGTEEASNNRRWVYQQLKKANWPLAPEDDKRARAICRDFDHIGFLCRRGLIPSNLVVETYNRNIVDMWDRLGRFVIKWRKQNRDEDYFWEFEWLAYEAAKAKKRIENRNQIVTVAELLRGAAIKMPPQSGTFKKAERADQPGVRQGRLW